jgi:hypothetical protein
VTRLEQRGAIAFTGAEIAAVIILLTTVWEYLFEASRHGPLVFGSSLRVSRQENAGSLNWSWRCFRFGSKFHCMWRQNTRAPRLRPNLSQ